jgi:glycosyltransferase involved in cell wall biosynthesis
MKVSGFTLVRNGVLFDYPFLESLRSLLPLVDELWINVGIGDDETLALVREFCAKESNGKAHYFESRWPLDDPEKKRGGKILSEQTNLALDRCTGDWCVYLQADEVLHEEDYGAMKGAMLENLNDSRVDGLLFEYVHFYGSYRVIQQSRNVYRREVRIIKRDSGARSVDDAQSFRKAGGEKLNVRTSGAKIYHYGWVRPPEKMKTKTFFFDQLYHGDPKGKDAENETPHTGDNYRYKKIWGLRPFKKTHPETMLERIKAKSWDWDLRNSRLEWSWRDGKKILLDSLERATGKRLFEYRSYRILP